MMGGDGCHLGAAPYQLLTGRRAATVRGGNLASSKSFGTSASFSRQLSGTLREATRQSFGDLVEVVHAQAQGDAAA